MIKNQQKNTPNYRLPLVIVGYVLFAVLVLSTLISTTVPLGVVFFQPHVQKSNVAVTLLALTIGAVLPMLFGYFTGDAAVRSKNALQHHFNGVLFGILAYWVTTLALLYSPTDILGSLGTNTRIVIMNMLPGVGVGIITAGLAVMHLRSKQAKDDVLTYLPFTLLLCAGVILTPVLLIASDYLSGASSLFSYLYLAVVVFGGLVCFMSLRRTRLALFQRVLWSAVSVSVLFIALYTFLLFESGSVGYLMPAADENTQTIAGGVALMLATTVWVWYWVLQVKTLKKRA